MKAPRYDLGAIFREYGVRFRTAHKISYGQAKVMRAIEICRTSDLGGHADKCDKCGHVEVSYNSCSNRHCPKCQGLGKLKWIDKIQNELLPVPYFHIIFTVPGTLNRLMLINQKPMYDILFKAATDTLKMLATDTKYLGAETGVLAVLHTWGQNLMDHPHIHTIVPAGGVDTKTGAWKNSSRKFFIPVKVISRVFRGKFLQSLKQAYNNNLLKFEGSIKPLKTKKSFQSLLDKLYALEWVVFAKKPFKNNAQVIKYLGNYTHRIAISNSRIINVEDNAVTFLWKDYRDKNKKKLMTLSINEFIRRFLLHVLPYRFYKIRYYGLFASRNKKSKLANCKKQLKAVIKNSSEKLTWQELLFKFTGFDVMKCPVCKKGQMKFFYNIPKVELTP